MVSPGSTLQISVSTAVFDYSVSPGFLAKRNKERDDDLIKAVECPSCEQVALPPIVNCNTGHIICSVCRPKVTRCKICSSNFTHIQNVAAEDLVALLDIKCFFPACGESFKGDGLKQHMLDCSYRPIRCNEMQLQDCNGQRIEFQNYVQHLNTVHACATVVNTEHLNFKIPTKNTTSMTDRVWPLVPVVSEGKSFIISRVMKDDVFYCAIAYLGPDLEASKFNARITMDSGSGKRNGGPRIEWMHPVHTFRSRLDGLTKCGHIACVCGMILNGMSNKKRNRVLNETIDTNEYSWNISISLEKA